jgi:hypothetical protein
MNHTPMPWEIPGAPQPADYVETPTNPYTVETLADELFEYANDIIRVVDSKLLESPAYRDLVRITGRMKKTANQASVRKR